MNKFAYKTTPIMKVIFEGVFKMANKTDMVIGGVELIVALGVSTLVGGAIAIVKPSKLGVIKK